MRLLYFQKTKAISAWREDRVEQLKWGDLRNVTNRQKMLSAMRTLGVHCVPVISGRTEKKRAVQFDCAVELILEIVTVILGADPNHLLLVQARHQQAITPHGMATVTGAADNIQNIMSRHILDQFLLHRVPRHTFRKQINLLDCPPPIVFFRPPIWNGEPVRCEHHALAFLPANMPRR